MAISVKDMELVRKTWEPVTKDCEGYGTIIFKTFLDKHDYYHLFAKIRDLPRDETLTQNKAFRNHGFKVVTAINEMIINLDNPEKLDQTFSSIGKMHDRRKITNLQFQQLQTVILDVLQGAVNLNQEESEAWQRTLSYTFAIVAAKLSLDS